VDRPQRAVRVGVLGSTRGSSMQPILRAICGAEMDGVAVRLWGSSRRLPCDASLCSAL